MARAWVVGPPAASSGRASLLDWLASGANDERPWLTFHQGIETDVLRFCDAAPLARRWAKALEDAGVGAGDRVAVFFPNGRDFVGAFFGAQWVGATAVPVPWPATSLAADLPASAKLLLEACRAKVVCAPPRAEGIGWPILSLPADVETTTPAREGEAAFLQFSSGSTGAPRGAVISPRAAALSALGMAEGLSLGPLDVGVSWLPFFHDMGLVGVVLTSLAANFPVHVLQPGEFLLRPSRWLELASRVQATMTVAPNFAYELVLRRVRAPKELDLSRLRAMLNGSEPVHRATIERFEAAYAPFGLRPGAVLPVYGLAENVLGVSFQGPGATDEDLRLDGRVVPSVGAPLRGLEVAVRDEAGAIVDEGVEGEVTVRGPTLMTGYFDDEAATARALRDGWLFTGDRGVLLGGRLYLTGREKELIIKLGRKFHPADVERIVADVADPPPNGVVAFSVDDHETHQESLVVVVEQRRASEEGLVDRIRGRVSAELGVMVDRVELVGAGALPRTTSGKLRRKECTARFSGAGR
ncbi:MAG: AMP-binding protein [Myxococcus sp.]|nr:AMP-binding protein [Myxococcus sp.]